jgi:hypothetical protein
MRPTRYTKAQVLAAERVSWADPHGDDEALYFYDGINFWRHSEGGGRRLTRASEAPARGWRHAEGCNCALCREAAALPEIGEEEAFAGRRT